MDRIVDWTPASASPAPDAPDVSGLLTLAAGAGLAASSGLSASAGLDAAAAPPPPPGLGKLDIANFEIRYAWDGAASQQDAVNGLAASHPDLLIMGGQYQVSLGPDVDFTSDQIHQIEADGKTVIGYMSIGAIQPALDRFDAIPASDSFAAGGTTWLKYWDPTGAAAYNPDLLSAYEGWIDDLAGQGFDGAFLDVMDSYVGNAAVDAAIGGASTTDDYLIATTALLNIIKQLGAYDAVNHPGFKLVLGHNPFLIEHYFHPGAFDNPNPDHALVAAVQQAVDGDLLESVDFTRPDQGVTRDILQDLAAGSPYGFGDATLMAQNYFPDASFTNGDPATRTALEMEIDAARLGFAPYATPTDHFGVDYPLFDVATAGPNALLAGEGGGKLNGKGGDDVVFGQDGADKLYGAAGADELSGGGGKDRLTGGAGQDLMTGGDGDDTFVFLSVKDSPKATHADQITDLSAGDTIDLQAIDADTTQAGDQAFVLVSKFHHTPGEAVLSYQADIDMTQLRLDVDGDGKADMTIAIKGDHADFTHFVL